MQELDEVGAARDIVRSVDFRNALLHVEVRLAADSGANRLDLFFLVCLVSLDASQLLDQLGIGFLALSPKRNDRKVQEDDLHGAGIRVDDHLPGRILGPVHRADPGLYAKILRVRAAVGVAEDQHEFVCVLVEHELVACGDVAFALGVDDGEVVDAVPDIFAEQMPDIGEETP